MPPFSLTPPIPRSASLPNLGAARAAAPTASPGERLQRRLAPLPSTLTPRPPDRNRQAYWQRAMAAQGTPMQILEAWRDAGPVEDRDVYDHFVNEVKLQLELGKVELKITRSPVLTLPPSHALSGFRDLHFEDCPYISEPPENFEAAKFEGFTVRFCPAFEGIPKLPVSLRQLCLDNCDGLSVFPQDFSHVTNLIVKGCSNLDLTSLRISPRLETLDLSQLSQLTVIHGPATGSQLSFLLIYDCPGLTSLPDLVHCTHLEQVSTNCPLTSLPESIAQWEQCLMDIDGSHFSDAICNRLDAIMNIPSWTGPMIELNLNLGGMVAPTRPVRPLAEEIASWLPESQVVSSAPWQAMAETEHGLQLARFLSRLRETTECTHPSTAAQFKSRVAHLIGQWERDPALLELCALQAHNAVEKCGDRVALAMMNMERAAQTHAIELQVQAGQYDHDPEALMALGQGMLYLDEIDKMAYAKQASMNFCDRTEVHLGYIVALAQSPDKPGGFALPVQMQTMLYPVWAGLRSDDIMAARQTLQGCTGLSPANGKLVASLAEWGPMQLLLQRTCPDTDSKANVGAALASRRAHLTAALTELEAKVPRPEDYATQAEDLMAQYNHAPIGVKHELLSGLVRQLLQAHQGVRTQEVVATYFS
jgi:hypothetical protein